MLPSWPVQCTVHLLNRFKGLEMRRVKLYFEQLGVSLRFDYEILMPGGVSSWVISLVVVRFSHPHLQVIVSYLGTLFTWGIFLLCNCQKLPLFCLCHVHKH